MHSVTGINWQQLSERTICQYLLKQKNVQLYFPGGSVVKNPPANAGDMGLIPDPGRSHMLQSN